MSSASHFYLDDSPVAHLHAEKWLLLQIAGDSHALVTTESRVSAGSPCQGAWSEMLRQTHMIGVWLDTGIFGCALVSML